MIYRGAVIYPVRSRQSGAVRAMWQRMSRKSRAKPPSPFRYFNSSPEVIRLVVLMDVRFPLLLRNVEKLGMTSDQHRARWSLAAGYPMVAPEYVETRRDLALKIGLGRKPGQKCGRTKKSAA